MKTLILSAETVNRLRHCEGQGRLRIPMTKQPVPPGKVSVFRGQLAYEKIINGQPQYSFPASAYDKGKSLCVLEPWIKTKDGYAYQADNLDDNITKWRAASSLPGDAIRSYFLIQHSYIDQLQEISTSECQESGLSLDEDLYNRSMSLSHADITTRYGEMWDRSTDLPSHKQFTWASNPYVWALSVQIVPRNIAEAN